VTVREIGGANLFGGVSNLLQSKTQFAAIQTKAANEEGKVKTSAARGHRLAHGKGPERSTRRPTQVGAMLGSEINIIGTRQSSRRSQRLWILSTEAMRLASRQDGSHWLAHGVECVLYI
jgi:hypothetical protein